MQIDSDIQLLNTRTSDSTGVSNGTGECNFSGQRDRSSIIVPGQRDNGTSQRNRTGQDSQNTEWDAGQNGTEQKRTL